MRKTFHLRMYGQIYHSRGFSLPRVIPCKGPFFPGNPVGSAHPVDVGGQSRRSCMEPSSPTHTTRGRLTLGNAPNPASARSNHGHDDVARSRSADRGATISSLMSPRNLSVMWRPAGLTHLTAGFFALSCSMAPPREAFTSSGMGSAMNVLIIDKIS